MAINGKTKIFRNKIIALFIFTITTFLFFFNSINSQFHFDDRSNISENPDMMVNELSLSSLKKATFTRIAGLRPVSYFSFALNYYFSKLNTTSYHIVNIIIHIINAFLIYLIILHLFGYAKEDDEKKKESILLSAFLTALFWMLTPLNSQVVVYIVQRMASLATLFFLLAFYTYLLSKEKNKILYLALTGIFYILSLMSKQNGVVFPLIIVMYEMVFVKKGELKNVTFKENLFFTLLFLIFAIATLFYGNKIYEAITSGYSIRDFTLYERLLTQTRVLVFYLSLLILPLPGRFCITHYFHKSISLVSPITTLAAFILIGSLFVLSIVRVKKSPYLSFAILWFFITMLVESTFLPLEMAYEHRMYLPCIFLVGVFIDFMVNRFYNTKKIPFIVLSVVIALILGSLSFVRSDDWNSGIKIWKSAVEKYPEDSRNHYNLASEYYHSKNYDEAMKEYKKVLEINPDDIEIYFNIASIYRSRGDYSAAADYYNEALENSKLGDELYVRSLNNLGGIYIVTGKYKKAEDTFKKLMKFYPKDGRLHYNLGQSLRGQGRYEDAVKEYALTIEYDRSNQKAYVEAIKTILFFNDVKRAEQFYKTYETTLNKLCIGDFIKGIIAERKREKNKSNEYFNSYLSCSKSDKKYGMTVIDSYVKEASQKIRMFSK